MSEKTLHPTFNLRWVPCQKKDSDAIIVVPGKYPEDSDNYFILQQFFADTEGGGEWCEIAVDWSYRNDSPKPTDQPTLPDVPEQIDPKNWYTSEFKDQDIHSLYLQQRQLIQWAQGINEYLKKQQA